MQAWYVIERTGELKLVPSLRKGERAIGWGVCWAQARMILKDIVRERGEA